MPDTWCIYHVKNCSHTRPVPKDKFVVIVCRDSTCMGFLINTRIHPFILKQPELLKSQVKIKVSDYNFLDYDSHIDCKDLYDFEDEELLDRRVPVNIITKAEIRKAIGDSATIEPRYQKLILHNS